MCIYIYMINVHIYIMQTKTFIFDVINRLTSLIYIYIYIYSVLVILVHQVQIKMLNVHWNGMKLGKGFGTCYDHSDHKSWIWLKNVVVLKNSKNCTLHGQKLPHWEQMGSEFTLVDTFGTAPKQNPTESSFFTYHPQIRGTICLDAWLWFPQGFRVKHVLKNKFLCRI